MSVLHQLAVLLRTAWYLKPSQVFYYIVRRYLPTRSIELTNTPPVRDSQSGEAPCSISGIYFGDTVFRFLNASVDLCLGEAGINWSADAQRRLWQYHLHYFDYLRESARPNHNKDRLIQSWIDSNPQGTSPGWDPFPTSLRIVNWIFYFRNRPVRLLPSSWLTSLYLQTLWLERNDEKHILANHYFENLKAIFFAGCFFVGDDANRWLQRGLTEIPRQLREQNLIDGGHYERSPQYHCLMLENYLDIFNFSNCYSELCPQHFIIEVSSAATRSLNWLAATLLPDGTIPLFNDSAFGASIPPDALFLYAKQLSLEVGFGNMKQIEIIDRPATGLYGCRLGGDMLIIDCGDIGPSYQPGHTHCDFLSYELMLSKQRIIVDTGVSEYEPGLLRDYVRSTRAHNTVSIDGEEQSEIWGEFRVARRAKKIGAVINFNDRVVTFRGSYKGFYGIKHRIRHQRSATVSLMTSEDRIQKLAIADYLDGHGSHNVESFIHLHPEVTLKPFAPGIIGLLFGRETIATIHISENQAYFIAPGHYCPEFGKAVSNRVIILQAQGNFPLSLSYEIRIATR